MNIEYVSLDAITPHPRNVREGDVGAIVQSIEANGIYRPLVVQRSTGYILAGNHTYAALLQMGASEAPVTYVDVGHEEALRILLVDNRTSDLAGYDEGALANLLTSLADTPDALAGTGYDFDDLDLIVGDLARDVGLSLDASLPVPNATPQIYDIQRLGENYTEADLRQIVLVLQADEFTELIGIYAAMQKADASLDTNTACALRLLADWAEQQKAGA